MMWEKGERGIGGGRANSGYDCVVRFQEVEGDEATADASVCVGYGYNGLCHT